MIRTAMISDTARQTGFGKARFKRVSGLTPEEREYAKGGGIVLFRSHPAGGRHGTIWRVVRYVPNFGFIPRVPSTEEFDEGGIPENER